MGSLSPVHWLIVIATVAIPLPAILKILKRTGHSGWWAIFNFLPILNWIGLYLLANTSWPNEERDRMTREF